MKINKDKKVRMSKWHVVPLNTEQQIYAAIDGYVSIRVQNQNILYCHKCIASENEARY